jgi:hypothetical protein
MLVQQANPKGYNNSTHRKARALSILSFCFCWSLPIQPLIISPLTSNTISKHKEIHLLPQTFLVEGQWIRILTRSSLDTQFNSLQEASSKDKKTLHFVLTLVCKILLLSAKDIHTYLQRPTPLRDYYCYLYSNSILHEWGCAAENKT